jgi:glutamate carboxypeptidase
MMDFNHYFRSRQGEMVNLLKQLVHLESPSSDKEAVDRCSTFVIGEFKKSGASVREYPQKDLGNFYQVEYPQGRDFDFEGKILILAHLDTVWPVGKINSMPFYASGDKLFGPGVLDMKAGLVMAVASIKALRQLNLRPQKKICLFLNSAEEIGSKDAYEIIQKLAKTSSYCLCLEPAIPGGALKMKRKGRLVAQIHTKGKSAHAGSPEEGINAIDELIWQLSQIKKLHNQQRTVNIGLISGGEKPNIVPDSASATLDFRYWKKADQDKILAKLKNLVPRSPDAKVGYSRISDTPPMEKTPASDKLLEDVRAIAESMGITLEDGQTGGGSDASIAAGTGLPVIDGLGPDGRGIHAEEEHILISSFLQRTALLTELLIKL